MGTSFRALNVVADTPPPSKESHLRSIDSDEPYDLIGIGFGPANLALAIALHDALQKQSSSGLGGRPPKVLFLEKQSQFAWHQGMLLPGTKMQISFVKDLATLRDPTSKFTFLNYLHKKNRLVQFTNLDTFQPLRTEFHDYMEWCASHFDDVVAYGKQAVDVTPHLTNDSVSNFNVGFRDAASGRHDVLRTKHVVIAVGGGANVPKPFPTNDSRVIHSSQYAKAIGIVLPDKSAPYNVAIVGAGQSAAEVYNDLHSRYPNSRTKLMFRGGALKPSDDSPFVNDIFDPDRVDSFFRRSDDEREASLAEDRATNYGVVRIDLLQSMYNKLYYQRIQNPDPSQWQHQILNYTNVVSVEPAAKGVRLRLKKTSDGQSNKMHEFNAVIVAAGYKRDVHGRMLMPCWHLMPQSAQESGKPIVGRNYQVQFRKGAVNNDAGIWLQGCNENTHGLSDTLLSILSTRGGEMVQSIFGDGDLAPRRAKL